MKIDQLDKTIEMLENEVSNIISYSDKLRELNDLAQIVSVASEKIEINSDITRKLNKSLPAEVSSLKNKTIAVHDYLTEEIENLKNIQIENHEQSQKYFGDQFSNLQVYLTDMNAKIDSHKLKSEEMLNALKKESELSFKKLKFRKNISDAVSIVMLVIIIYLTLR